jgi:hypothetical protein
LIQGHRFAIIRGVCQPGELKLPHVVQAAETKRPCFGLIQSSAEKAYENRDYGHDRHQLKERKPIAPGFAHRGSR